MERRLLQAAIIVACLVPLAAGAAGAVLGVEFLARGWPGHSLDSHLRYLSGILFAIGVAYLTCVPAVERRVERFRLLSALVVTGGLARAAATEPAELRHLGSVLPLIMELGVVPLLTLWQTRIASRYRAVPSSPGPASAVGR